MGLNAEQERAVLHGSGPLMVLAGAGSGKTRVLVHRIAHLVGCNVPPHRILAVTFTNKAAGEMRERLEKMLGPIARPMWISTFHSTAARLLRMYPGEAEVGRDFAIYDDDDQLKIIAAILKELNLDDAASPRTVLSAIDRAKTRGADPIEENAGRYLDDILRDVYPRYRQRLRQENAVDFNDLLLKVLDLARHPGVGPLLARMFDHVLVDEFQDTNLVQYQFVRHLVSTTRNLTVVGDDDQSIYSWRGAEPRNLLDFDRDFRDAAVVKLEQNYRSSGHILQAANGVISRNLDRHEKELWTEREPGEPVLWEETADERAEAEFVALAIKGLCNEEGRQRGDMAVLYRTHAQSRVFEEAFRAHTINYRIVGGVSFFQRKEIKDIRAYLRLVLNPAADLAFERIVNVPARGIGKTTLERVRKLAVYRGVSLFEAAELAARGEISSLANSAARKLGTFVQIIKGLREVSSAGASVAEVIIQAVERSTYRDRLEKEDSLDSRDRLLNLSELVSMASDFDDETDGMGTLTGFDERISLASVNDGEDGRGSAVTLMTVHAAKGLEFPIVFVAGMEDGLFPSLRERDGESDQTRALEEERRLAYVAFTRGMDRLILTGTRTRRVWSEIRLNRPSRFLEEIPAECLAVRERQTRARVTRTDIDEQFHGRRRDSGFDDFDQSDYEDDVPSFDVRDEGEDEVVDVGVGSHVRHSVFGRGVVVECRSYGREQLLVIDFSSVGRQTVGAAYIQPEKPS